MNRKIKLVLGLVVAASSLLIVGCRHFVPSGEHETPFPGLTQMATETNLPIRIFLIHGVSHHDPGWATNTYLNPILTKMNWHFDGSNGGTVWTNVLVAGANNNGFAARLTRYTIADTNAHRMVAYELTWSPLVDPFKTNRLSADAAVWRPWANGLLRDAIDSSLVDAVLYASGFDDDIMGRTTSKALRMFYSGELDGGLTKPQLESSPVVFVSESLGSKMLMDAILKEHRTNSAAMKPNPQFEQMIKNNRYIFMMANQLALLAMPEPSTNGPVPPVAVLAAPKKAPVLEEFVAAHHKISGKSQVQIIAFSDLYDDLSWKVEDADLGAGEHLRPDNFNPVNAIDWFWLYENPRTAHDGYGANEKVVNTVVNGWEWKGK